MLGQEVDATRPDLADGYYLYPEGEGPAENPCGGLRQGFMMIGGNRIPTCGGILNTEHLPDLVLVDDWFKPMLKPLLIVAIVLLLVAIYKNLG